MSLHTWSWLFLIIYIALMIGLGWYASFKVSGADDFATARKGYGPFVLALAFASTAASGATFLGLPGLTYTYGMSTLWIAFLYPVGIYLGVLICQNTIGRYGNLANARSIPEYLGQRYQSEGLRISAAVFSLLLLFYLAGQMVAGLVMFEMMLGLPKFTALVITTVVLLAYVTLGGAHADIITDSVQGILMVILALLILVISLSGVGTNGFEGLLSNLESQDPALVQNFNPAAAITTSSWSYFSVAVAHIPLGLLPHIGNKLWALKDEGSRNRFLIMAFTFGMILPAITLGGATARAILGDDLIANGLGGANIALPALFIEIFPSWLAAMLGVGILAAVMSTADGLVISTSQVFANDIYRCSIVPRMKASRPAFDLERNVLIISRIITVLVLVGAAVLAWMVIDVNIVLLMWAGIGGFTAALMGPLVMGSIWQGVTRSGAIAGFWTGAVIFILIHAEIIDGLWLVGTDYEHLGRWFALHAKSPYSSATLGGFASVLMTAIVSRLSDSLPSNQMTSEGS